MSRSRGATRLRASGPQAPPVRCTECQKPVPLAVGFAVYPCGHTVCDRCDDTWQRGKGCPRCWAALLGP